MPHEHPIPPATPGPPRWLDGPAVSYVMTLLVALLWAVFNHDSPTWLTVGWYALAVVALARLALHWHRVAADRG